jgi:hypothetical protein
MHTELQSDDLKGRDHQGDLIIDRKIHTEIYLLVIGSNNDTVHPGAI